MKKAAKKTTALARTTSRTITRPERTANVVPFSRNETTGAIALPDQQKFQGASQLVLSKKEQSALRVPFPDDQHDVLPTGEVYVTVHYARDRADEVLGVGQWALVPIGTWSSHGKERRGIITHEYHFYVRGCFVRPVIGEADYYEDNNRVSWATAMEVVYSNAITRALKFLGVAREVWDKRWNDRWLDKYAVRVWVKRPKDDQRDIRWRRRDAKKLAYEQGHVEHNVVHDDEPAPRAASKPATGDFITRQQAEDLVALAREHGVKPSGLADIIGAETGQAQIRGIKTSQFKKIMAAVEKATPAKG